MSTELVSRRLKTEIQEYFEFLELFQKKRPTDLQDRVNEIVETESSIIQRINLIRQLDDDAKAGVKRSVPLTEELSKRQSLKAKAESAKLSRKERLIIRKWGFFSYLFLNNGRRMLLQFGKRTETIQFYFFGTQKETTVTAEVHIKQLAESAKQSLIGPIAYILSNSWQIIDVISYNLVALFDKFLHAYIKAAEQFKTVASIHENFRLFETFIVFYLRIVQFEEYKERLKDAIYEALFFNKEYKDELRHILHLLDELINTDKRRLCFSNIILAVYSLHYNHFIKFNDLLDHYSTPPVESEIYDFPPRILPDVKAFIAHLEEEYNEVEHELFFLRYAGENFNPSEDTESSFSLLMNRLTLTDYLSKGISLATLMNSKDTSVKKQLFSNFKNDCLKVIYRSAKSIAKFYKPLLGESIEVYENDEKKAHKKVIIIKNNIFHSFFTKIESFTNELNVLFTNFEGSTIPFETYDTYIRNNALPSEKEEKFCTLMLKLVEAFYELGNQLAMLLYQHYKAQNKSGEDLLKSFGDKDKPIERIDDFVTTPRMVPYYYNLVHLPEFLRDQRLINCLEDLCTVLFTLPTLYNYEKIINRLLKKKSLLRTAKSCPEIQASLPSSLSSLAL